MVGAAPPGGGKTGGKSEGFRRSRRGRPRGRKTPERGRTAPETVFPPAFFAFFGDFDGQNPDSAGFRGENGRGSEPAAAGIPDPKTGGPRVPPRGPKRYHGPATGRNAGNQETRPRRGKREKCVFLKNGRDFRKNRIVPRALSGRPRPPLREKTRER
jgi:hypothetical protein